MDTYSLNQLADRRSEIEKENRKSIVGSQMNLLAACLDIGAPIERLLPVIETWLMQNLEKR
jgi:hypothetical protein